MIKAIHIEDEPGNIELLKNLISLHCNDIVKLEGHAGNIKNAISLIKNKRPQLVYLDIELNRGNAFELLEKLNESGEFNFTVIFITAFNEYATRAFRYNAVDYLLKPIDINDLKEATTKAVQKIMHSQTNENVVRALKQLKTGLTLQKIGLPVADGIDFVDAETIISCEAKGSYTIINLTNSKKITIIKSLGDIEYLLPATHFIRVHNSWLINSRHLKKYYKGKNSYIEMEGGATIPVSMRKKGDFLDFINCEE